MELADKTDESALDMTAAEIAPRPMKETHPGARYWSTMGRTNRVSVMIHSAVELLTNPASTAPSTDPQSEMNDHRYFKWLPLLHCVKS